MAELMQKTGRKNPPRIDFTPMVDLGFLLITFFIFTASLSEPRTMDIQMPSDGGPGTTIKHFTAMTVFLGDKHSLYYFKGHYAMNNDYSKLEKATFGSIRDALLTHKEQVRQDIINQIKGSEVDDFPFILVKASKESDSGDLVNLLDELAIVGMNNYALMDLTAEDDLALNSMVLR